MFNILASCLLILIASSIHSMESTSQITTNQQIVTQKIIKTSKYNREKNLCLSFSNDGNHFIENVSTDEKLPQIHVWQTAQSSPIITLDGYSQGIFSPSNDYVIAYNTSIPTEQPKLPILYCIANKLQNEIVSDAYKSIIYHTYKKPTISPNGRLILQSFDIKTPWRDIPNYVRNKYSLYSVDNNYQLTEIPLDEKLRHEGMCILHPDNQHLIYFTNDNMLVISDTTGKKHVINTDFENYSSFYNTTFNMNQDGSLLIIQPQGELKLLNIKNLDNIQCIKSLGSYHSHNILFIPEKKEILCLFRDYYLNTIIALFDENGNTLHKDLTRKYIKQCTTDNKNHFAFLFHHYDGYLNRPTDSTLLLWDLSNNKNKIKQQEVTLNNIALNIAFNNDLILAQGLTTQLFNTNGNLIGDLGKNQAYAINPLDSSVLTINQDTNILRDAPFSEYTLEGPTTIFLASSHQNDEK